MRSLLASLVLAAASALTASAQLVDLDLDPIVCEPGEIITVDIRADGLVADLRGYTLDLHYNRDRVSVFSIVEGPLMLSHTPTFLYWEDLGANGSSTLHIDHAILGGLAGATGPGVLCTVLFRAEDCGVESLWLDDAQFRDLDNDPLPVALGAMVEHQVCQVPPLYIDRLADGRIQLSWQRALNALEYHLWWRERWYHPWQPLATTTDTSWVDPATPGPQMRLYRLTLLHD